MSKYLYCSVDPLGESSDLSHERCDDRMDVYRVSDSCFIYPQELLRLRYVEAKGLVVVLNLSGELLQNSS